MSQIELKVNKREILGKKVKSLRRQGITPVHLFGHGIESVALQCDTAKLQRSLAQAGRTRLISLKIANEKEPRIVVLRDLQIEPLTGKSLHVDFYQVRMEEKVKVEIPVVLVGEAPALKVKGSTLVHELNTLTVECLPGKIPTRIELSLSSLTETEQALRVKDIKLDEDITVLNDPEQSVVRISSKPVEVVEEKPAEEKVAPTAEAAPAEEAESKEE